MGWQRVKEISGPRILSPGRKKHQNSLQEKEVRPLASGFCPVLQKLLLSNTQHQRKTPGFRDSALHPDLGLERT